MATVGGVALITALVVGVIGHAVSTHRWFLLVVVLWFPMAVFVLHDKATEVLEVRLSPDERATFTRWVGKRSVPVAHISAIYYRMRPVEMLIVSFQDARSVHMRIFDEIDGLVRRLLAMNPAIQCARQPDVEQSVED